MIIPLCLHVLHVLSRDSHNYCGAYAAALGGAVLQSMTSVTVLQRYAMVGPRILQIIMTYLLYSIVYEIRRSEPHTRLTGRAEWVRARIYRSRAITLAQFCSLQARVIFGNKPESGDFQSYSILQGKLSRQCQIPTQC